jgi:hypothetical protein
MACEGAGSRPLGEALQLTMSLAIRRRGARPSRPRPQIEFLCRPEDKGVIAEPVPARTVQPAWFKRLPGQNREQLSATNNGLTVKRCVPFLDAMSLGWIVPLAATVRLEIADAGKIVTAGWEFAREMVSHHGAAQTAGGPWEPRPTMKFHNPWTIRTPPGWSCLFVPPLNRPNGVFEVLSGFVDTDTYVAPVNFPFVAIADDGVHTLHKGTPLIQVIPLCARRGNRGHRSPRVRAGGRRARLPHHAGRRRLVPARVARPALTQPGSPRRLRLRSQRAISQPSSRLKRASTCSPRSVPATRATNGPP